MSANKIEWKDLFDLTDNSDIKDAIVQIEKLNTEYEVLSKNIVKQTDKIDKSYQSLVTETKGLTDSTKKLTTAEKEQANALSAQSKATDDVFKKAKKLVEAKENARKLEELYGKSVDSLNAKLKAQTLEFNQLNTSTKEGARQAERMGKANRELKKEIKDLTDVSRTQNNVFERTEKSYDSMTKANNKLKAELRALPNSFDKTNEAAKKLRAEISKNTQELKEWDKEIGDNFRNVGNYGSALDGLGEKFAGLAGGGGGGGGIGGVISGLGGMVPQLAVAGAAIGAVAAGVDQLNELTKELRVQFKSVGDLLGLVGEEAQTATAGIRASADTFDQDFNEVLRASNSLMEAFGVESEDALEIINNGFITGANGSEELLDSVKEYSVFFRDAGLSAEDLVNVIRASTDQGIFSDKGIDAVKEFGLRINEMTSSTKDALIPLGKARNEQILLAVESGNAGEALRLVTQGMDDVELSASQLATITADVFGGPGEDVGKEFLISLGKISTETDKGTDSLNEYQRAQLEVLKVNQDFEEILVEMGSRFTDLSLAGETFWTRIKTLGVDLFIVLIDGLTPLIVLFQDFWELLKSIGSSFKFFNTEGNKMAIVTKVIGIAMKIALLPIKAVLIAINFIIGAFNRFILQSAPVQKAISFIGTGFKNLVTAIKEVPKVMNGLINAFRVGFSELKNLILTQGQIISDAFLAIFDPTKSVKDVLARGAKAFSNYGGVVKQAFLDGYNAIEIKKAIEDSIEPPKKDKVKVKIDDIVTTTKAGKDKKTEKKKELDDLQAILDAAEKRRLARLKGAIKARLDANKTESNLLVAQLQQRYNDGKISKENFEVAKLAIEKQYNDLSLQNEEDALKNLIDLNLLKGNELIAVKKRLSEIELAQTAISSEQVKEVEKAKFEDIAKFAQDGFNAIVQFGGQLLENSIENSEFLIEKNEIDRQRAVELAGDNEEQIRIINENADKERAKLEDKRRKDQVKQAKLDRANALITIAINTAVAISKVIGQTGIFGLAAWIPVAALGAIQLATVASQPIPQFYKGTESAPGGLAEVAERGSEIIVSPSGKIDYINNRQIRHVEKGSRIIPNKETMDIERAIQETEKDLYQNGDVALNQLQKIEKEINIDVAKMVQEGNEKTIKAIKEMERFSFEGTNRGIRAFVENSKGRQELLNDRYS